MKRQPATRRYPSNRDLDRGYRPAPEPKVEFESPLPIIGLTAPVPPGFGD